MQAVNSLLAVYDKSGDVVLQATPIRALWSGLGGPCEQDIGADPVVLYDHLANRWLVSNASFASVAHAHECIAVSTSDDPTGSYYRYDFATGPDGDYPKLGLWPDGYYMTTAGFEAPTAFVFERDAMLFGLDARMIGFSVACVCLPSTLLGPPPPAGTPNTLVGLDLPYPPTSATGDADRLWDFRVDWAMPESSALVRLPDVPTPAFDTDLHYLWAPTDRPMYRLNYRLMPTGPTLVLNHTVDGDGHDQAGIRWAELRRDANGWSLSQTGTFAPGRSDMQRWMGSVAIDKLGDIALGYSYTDRRTPPSIRYATRLVTDPPGMVGTELELQRQRRVAPRHQMGRLLDDGHRPCGRLHLLVHAGVLPDE